MSLELHLNLLSGMQGPKYLSHYLWPPECVLAGNWNQKHTMWDAGIPGASELLHTGAQSRPLSCYLFALGRGDEIIQGQQISKFLGTFKEDAVFPTFLVQGASHCKGQLLLFGLEIWLVS